jgi:LysR family transcriptional regulator, chromosome initiation inhibitor
MKKGSVTMLDYAALAAVASVAREGSFERAAGALGVTPSAVSQRVRALEDRLGAILIVRGQPCTATAIGARLCAHVDRVRLLEGEMASALPALAGHGAEAGPPTIRVAVNADSLATWFVPAIAAFAGRGDRLVDLVIAGEDHTAERLRSGDVLAAVTTDRTPVQGCRTVPLGALRYAATASPSFMTMWFAGGVTASSLARAPVLRFDRQDHLHDRWARATLGTTPDAPPTHWIPSTHGFVDAALAGLGWCVNPTPLVADHLASGRLVSLAAERYLDVPLYWQHARIGTRLLDTLTRDVVAAAARGLI